jgi:hypothetical protein
MSTRPLIRSLVPALAACAATFALTAAAQAEVAPQWYSNATKLTTTPAQVTLWGEVKLESVADGEIVCHDVMSGSVWNEGGRGMGSLEGWGTNACKAPRLEEELNILYAKAISEGVIKGPLTVFATSELPLELEPREAETCVEKAKTELTQCPNKTERSVSSLPLRIRRKPSSFPWKMRLIRETREEEPEQPVAEVGIPPTGQTCFPLEGGKSAKWQAVPAGCIRIDIISPQIPDELIFYGALKPRLVNGAGNGLDATKLEFNAEGGKVVSNRNEGPETYGQGGLKITGSEARELIVGK